MTLDGIESEKAVRVVAVRWDLLAPDEAKRLRALGVDEGAEVEIRHRGIFGAKDPIALRLGNMTIAVRRNHARAVEVAEIAPPTSGQEAA